MSEDVPQWACTKCGETFAPASWMVKASFRQCPACKREYERTYRALRKQAGDPVRHAPVAPGTRAANHRKAVADPVYRLKLNEKARQRYWANPERRVKVKVRSITSRAIAAGKVARKPCQVCGHQPAEAHHDDYTKPLEVRWLCRAHHREHHSLERKAL